MPPQKTPNAVGMRSEQRGERHQNGVSNLSEEQILGVSKDAAVDAGHGERCAQEGEDGKGACVDECYTRRHPNWCSPSRSS